jgi:hemolysin-activating ACP:hemolysin acyltransferase
MWQKIIDRNNFHTHETDIMNLYINSPVGQTMTQWELRRYILNPIHYKQMMIFGENDRADMVATWARLSDIEAERFEKSLNMVHWCCGQNIYIQDVIGNNLNNYKAMKLLKKYFIDRYQQPRAQWFRMYYDKNTYRKGHW